MNIKHLTKSFIKSSSLVFKEINKTSILTSSIKYNYFSAIDKPIDSLALNSIAQASCQLIQFGYNDLMLSPQFSCIVGGFMFRIATHAFTSFFQGMKSKNPQRLLLNKWIEKIFLVDFRRDCQFQNFTQQYRKTQAKYYTLGSIMRNIVNSYMILNFFRGCHYTIYSQKFTMFLENTEIVTALDLYDQSFVIPAIIIGLNYITLKTSKHPFLLKLTKSQNSLYALNIAFIGGLIFTPFSTIYHFSYIGIILGHLFVRSLGNLTKKFKLN